MVLLVWRETFEGGGLGWKGEDVGLGLEDEEELDVKREVKVEVEAEVRKELGTGSNASSRRSISV